MVIGDGILTPAISVLSAVEGIKVGYDGLSQGQPWVTSFLCRSFTSSFSAHRRKDDQRVASLICNLADCTTAQLKNEFHVLLCLDGLYRMPLHCVLRLSIAQTHMGGLLEARTCSSLAWLDWS
jgi:hypothetical protein